MRACGGEGALSLSSCWDAVVCEAPTLIAKRAGTSPCGRSNQRHSLIVLLVLPFTMTHLAAGDNMRSLLFSER